MSITFKFDLTNKVTGTLLSQQEINNLALTNSTWLPNRLLSNIVKKHNATVTLDSEDAIHLKGLINSGQITFLEIVENQVSYNIGAGYFAGGSTGDITAVAYKLVYATNMTAAQTSANLSQARVDMGSVSNDGVAGYFAGGNTDFFSRVATTDKLVYGTDTTGAQTSANLTAARDLLAGASNRGSAGYLAGGFQPSASNSVTTVDKLVYSTDVTATQGSAALTQRRLSLAGASNHGVAAYYVGGASTSTVVTNKLLYSNETTSAQTSANLSILRRKLAGVGNTGIAAYFGGGYDPNEDADVDITDKLVYTTDTTSAQASAYLTKGREGLAGASNDGVAGYFAGGADFDGILGLTDKLNYSTEVTTLQFSARLGVPTSVLAGLDG